MTALRILVIAVVCFISSTLAIKSDPDFVERLLSHRTAKQAIKCFVCSPCNVTNGDAWDGPILAECLPGENFCFKETHADGTQFLSCSDDCQNGTFTADGRTFTVECCSDKDGCNRIDSVDTDPPPPPVRIRSTSTTSTTSTTTTKPITTEKTSPTIVAITEQVTTIESQSPTIITTTTTESTTKTTVVSSTATKSTITTTPSTTVLPTTTTAILTVQEIKFHSTQSTFAKWFRPRKCFACAACNTTVRAKLILCRPTDKYCFKEIRNNGTIMQGCTEECPHHTITLSPKADDGVLVSECCNDHGGCNGHIGDHYYESSSSAASLLRLLITTPTFLLQLFALFIMFAPK